MILIYMDSISILRSESRKRQQLPSIANVSKKDKEDFDDSRHSGEVPSGWVSKNDERPDLWPFVTEKVKRSTGSCVLCVFCVFGVFRPISPICQGRMMDNSKMALRLQLSGHSVK